MTGSDSVPELLKITQGVLAKEELVADPELENLLHKLYTRQKDRPHSGNARAARKVAETIVNRHHLRLSKLPLSERSPTLLRTAVLSDALGGESKVDVAELERQLKKLDRLIGLENLKQAVQLSVDAFMTARTSPEHNGFLPRLALVFEGGSGTGKSEACRRLELIVQAMGAFGNSTSPEIRIASGALADDGRAVEAQFDSGDRLDKPTFIILSGTQKDVEGLFRANPRLGAKFNQRIVFPDYTVDERVAMAVLMLEDEGLELSDAGTKCLGELLSGPSRQFLVNGTRVRRIIDAAVGRHWHRISRSRSADRNKDSLRVIEPIDFEGVEAELPVGLENARQLGFKATLVADEKELLFG